MQRRMPEKKKRLAKEEQKNQKTVNVELAFRCWMECLKIKSGLLAARQIHIYTVLLNYVSCVVTPAQCLGVVAKFLTCLFLTIGKVTPF